MIAVLILSLSLIVGIFVGMIACAAHVRRQVARAELSIDLSLQRIEELTKSFDDHWADNEEILR